MKGNGKYFDIEGSGEVHNVRLSFDDNGNFLASGSSCPCDFGSTYRWIEKNKDKLCTHIKQAYKKYQNEKVYN